MNINEQNSIAFKTKIKIISPDKFRQCVSELYRAGNLQNISQYDINPGKMYAKCKAYSTDAENIYTKHIRTCSGLLVANKGKKPSLFGHFYNSKENIKDTEALDPYIKGSNAILIGSKNFYYYSTELFRTLKCKLRKNNIPTTLFQRLKLEWEANMAYLSGKDELLLCVKKADDAREYVRNFADLKKVFGKVKISPFDTIEFDTKQKPTFWENLKYRLNNKSH